MRGRVLFWLSLSLNVALIAIWLHYARRVIEKTDAPAPGPAALDPGKVYKTNVVVRRQNFTWNEIESPDYATYIAKLRAIGCPEATIRDIIVADVNQHFARRRATDVVTAEQQWWRSEPDPDVTQAASEKLKALENDRRTLLTTLLGPEWESSYYPYPAHPDSPPLDGPLLGALSPQTKQAIRDMEGRAAERRQTYLDALKKDDKQPDPAELARMRQQTRNDLAQVLNPDQLEEYLLRYSENGTALRNELNGMNPTPEGFRTLFHLTDPIDQQLQLLAGATDPESVKRRQEVEQQRDRVIQDALGPDEYKKYKLVQDPAYRDAQSVAQYSGAPPEKIIPLYEINRATEQEQQSIRSDSTLTGDQKAQKLEAVQTAQQNALRRLLGEEIFKRYLQQSSKP